jgi:tetratricopeptide (TPR) repeat protein
MWMLRVSRRSLIAFASAAAMFALAACAPPETPAPERPSILLVTLDTTRADVVDAQGAPPSALARETTVPVAPAFGALAARGVRFTQAYATAPQTLPSHVSMMSGLYPAGHGVHENGRRYDGRIELVAEKLRAAGWATAAFVSGFPLDRQFGLERGFALYDDDFGGANERPAAATTTRAVEWLARESTQPLFLWVHYYDPHEPYEPPEPYRARFAQVPYLGEVAAMDAELGGLIEAFEARVGAAQSRILVVGDHGESLGEHGEALHGNLLYQAVVRVPLVVAGGGIEPATRDEPLSIRRVFDTVLDWAGLPGGERTLLAMLDEPALGEAMQPYLLYGWQPQIMAVGGVWKAIRAGAVTELYDVRADPREQHDRSADTELPRTVGEALREYPLPASMTPDGGGELDAEARKRLASLGYFASGAPPKLNPDAPRPRDMTGLFAALDLGSGLFARGEYAAAIPVFERVLAEDPGNLSVALRLAAAHSALGHRAAADDFFARAAAIDPGSLDLDHYRALHELRNGDWQSAKPRLERVVAAMPERLPALEALARVRQHEERIPEAIALYERAIELEREPAGVLLALGELAMSIGDTAKAVGAFERARDLQGDAFDRQLELGVLYLDQQRYADAAAALDQVPAPHAARAMALFKRAQVAVLLGEPDAAERVAAARRGADAVTRALIENERLFTRY